MEKHAMNVLLIPGNFKVAKASLSKCELGQGFPYVDLPLLHFLYWEVYCNALAVSSILSDHKTNSKTVS